MMGRTTCLNEIEVSRNYPETFVKKSRGKAVEKVVENYTNELRSIRRIAEKFFVSNKQKKESPSNIDRHRHLVHLISTTIKGISHVEEKLLHNTDQLKFLSHQSNLWHYLNSANG
jgi:hypothetical protein